MRTQPAARCEARVLHPDGTPCQVGCPGTAERRDDGRLLCRAHRRASWRARIAGWLRPDRTA